jgi:hypothetical protein
MQNNKRFNVVALLAAVCMLATAPVAQAALSASDQTSILSGISASDTVFYAIGGGILVVLAGIWGFKKVKGLLGN